MEMIAKVCGCYHEPGVFRTSPIHPSFYRSVFLQPTQAVPSSSHLPFTVQCKVSPCFLTLQCDALRASGHSRRPDLSSCHARNNLAITLRRMCETINHQGDREWHWLKADPSGRDNEKSLLNINYLSGAGVNCILFNSQRLPTQGVFNVNHDWSLEISHVLPVNRR